MIGYIVSTVLILTALPIQSSAHEAFAVKEKNDENISIEFQWLPGTNFDEEPIKDQVNAKLDLTSSKEPYKLHVQIRKQGADNLLCSFIAYEFDPQEPQEYLLGTVVPYHFGTDAQGPDGNFIAYVEGILRIPHSNHRQRRSKSIKLESVRRYLKSKGFSAPTSDYSRYLQDLSSIKLPFTYDYPQSNDLKDLPRESTTDSSPWRKPPKWLTIIRLSFTFIKQTSSGKIIQWRYVCPKEA